MRLITNGMRNATLNTSWVSSFSASNLENIGNNKAAKIYPNILAASKTDSRHCTPLPGIYHRATVFR